MQYISLVLLNMNRFLLFFLNVVYVDKVEELYSKNTP